MLLFTASTAQPVSLTLIDQSWMEKDYRDWRLRELREFTRQTGIQVELLPAPESAVEQLALWQKLLESQSRTPDVYAVDVIWPGLLAEHLMDLKPYWTAEELAGYFPELIANDTVNGRLVAIPNQVGIGMLFYRTDLLREYGYGSPPASWDELEKMAARMQAGERRKGRKNFWGFVWQGGPSEALTCNALEWQASEGGGRIVEDDGTITVNNRDTMRAWERAARWVGSISPPGVVAYKEWDAFNVWQSGDAAFMRAWTGGAYIASRANDSSVKDKFDLTVLPAGRAGHAGTMGGLGYGVSRYSVHSREAVLLVHYLCSRVVELLRSRGTAEPPSLPDLYEDSAVAKANPYFARVKQAYLEAIVRRPSTVTGRNYPAVSRAYFEAAHSVLTRQRSAGDAVVDLERELVRITGLAARHR
jgi:trehalose/maltose transport system substrate-binding protein